MLSFHQVIAARYDTFGPRGSKILKLSRNRAEREGLERNAECGMRNAKLGQIVDSRHILNLTALGRLILIQSQISDLFVYFAWLRHVMNRKGSI